MTIYAQNVDVKLKQAEEQTDRRKCKHTDWPRKEILHVQQEQSIP